MRNCLKYCTEFYKLKKKTASEIKKIFCKSTTNLHFIQFILIITIGDIIQVNLINVNIRPPMFARYKRH